MTDAGKPYLDAILAQGIPVVRSSKIANGYVVPQGNSQSSSLFLGASFRH